MFKDRLFESKLLLKENKAQADLDKQVKKFKDENAILTKDYHDLLKQYNSKMKRK
jgi:hypothetical protein